MISKLLEKTELNIIIELNLVLKYFDDKKGLWLTVIQQMVPSQTNKTCATRICEN